MCGWRFSSSFNQARQSNPPPLFRCRLDVNNVSTTCDHQSFVLLLWRVISSTTSLDRLMHCGPDHIEPATFEPSYHGNHPTSSLAYSRSAPAHARSVKDAINLPADHSHSIDVTHPRSEALLSLIYLTLYPSTPLHARSRRPIHFHTHKRLAAISPDHRLCMSRSGAISLRADTTKRVAP